MMFVQYFSLASESRPVTGESAVPGMATTTAVNPIGGQSSHLIEHVRMIVVETGDDDNDWLCPFDFFGSENAKWNC